ncbi:hypothetical protein C5S31_07060 [ANME-1 cluster archaeon GoMg2]|nr:hypothetical protein [ANME-1 cluster archaeon GoMg2]
MTNEEETETKGTSKDPVEIKPDPELRNTVFDSLKKRSER